MIPHACEPDDEDGRFLRDCDYCGRSWIGRVCQHADHQEPCPRCDVLPRPQPLALVP